MRTVSWVPVLMAALAVGVWMAGLPAGDGIVDSRPAKSGRDLPRYGMRPTTASLAAWAGRDPDAAAGWAMALEGEARNAALGVVAVEVVGYSPALAIRCAEGISDPRQRGEMLGFALAQQATGDPSAAFEWLARDESGEEIRSLVECSVLPALAEADPPRIARLLADGNVTPRAVDAVLAATVQRWTQQDAHAAAAWVMEFDDERTMKAAMPSLIGIWTQQERGAPAAWIETLAAGPARDEACAAYAAALAIVAPEEAEAWAEKIGEKELLAETLVRIRCRR